MEGATHFIEVWKGGFSGRNNTSPIIPIQSKRLFLRATQQQQASKTLFVWNIKFKKPK